MFLSDGRCMAVKRKTFLAAAVASVALVAEITLRRHLTLFATFDASTDPSRVPHAALRRIFSICARRSATSHPVVPGPTLCGAGKRPCLTQRQSVERDVANRATTVRQRTNPCAGRIVT